MLIIQMRVGRRQRAEALADYSPPIEVTVKQNVTSLVVKEPELVCEVGDIS